MKIKDRIKAALEREPLNYFELMRAVFPPGEFFEIGDIEGFPSDEMKQ